MIKRGFTLVELLAVIVILAIIALIAVPIVIHIINDSKTSSEKESLNLYTDTVEKAITKKQMSDPNFNPDKCDIQRDGNLECFNGTTSLGIVEVEMKGDMPTSGTIIVKNNNIKYENIVLNGVTYYEKKTESFSIGDKVLYNNITYYVIEDSDSSNDMVKILKEYPLTKAEIDALNLIDIDVTESNSYGNVKYGDSTDYSASIVKQVVDAWAATMIKNNDVGNARLITKDEIDKNFEFEEIDYKPCGDACGVVVKVSVIKNSWMYGNYILWTMTSKDVNTMWIIITSGELAGNPNNITGNAFAIRPVIELNKSAQITKLDS